MCEGLFFGRSESSSEMTSKGHPRCRNSTYIDSNDSSTVSLTTTGTTNDSYCLALALVSVYKQDALRSDVSGGTAYRDNDALRAVVAPTRSVRQCIHPGSFPQPREEGTDFPGVSINEGGSGYRWKSCRIERVCSKSRGVREICQEGHV